MSFSVIVIVIVSIISTFLITHHRLERKRGSVQQTNMPTCQAVYEDMSNIQPGIKEFNMDDNSAYGPLTR